MIFLLFVFFIISSAFVVNKYIALFLTPSLFVAIRMGISGILLAILYCRKIENWQYFKENFFTILLVAFFTTFIPSLCRAFALQHILASRAAFWGTLEPFITVFWTYILYNVAINRNQFLGCMLSVLATIFFIIMNSKENLICGTLLCTADIIQLSSHIISRFGWIQAQNFLQKNILNPEQFNAFSFMTSGILALFLFFIQYNITDKFIISNFNTNFKFIGALIYTIVIGNMIAYTLYAHAIKNESITYVAIAGLSMPLFVHLLSSCFLQESLSYTFFISLIFIAIALYVFQKQDYSPGENNAE